VTGGLSFTVDDLSLSDGIRDVSPSSASLSEDPLRVEQYQPAIQVLAWPTGDDCGSRQSGKTYAAPLALFGFRRFQLLRSRFAQSHEPVWLAPLLVIELSVRMGL
jgi:hypothetical protein